jgi:hypothetical protein
MRSKMSETGGNKSKGDIKDGLMEHMVEEIAQAVFLKLEDKQDHTQRLFHIDQAARYLGMTLRFAPQGWRRDSHSAARRQAAL